MSENIENNNSNKRVGHVITNLEDLLNVVTVENSVRFGLDLMKWLAIASDLKAKRPDIQVKPEFIWSDDGLNDIVFYCRNEDGNEVKIFVNTEEDESQTQRLLIDDHHYLCRKITFDLNSFDEDGVSEKYPEASYIVIGDEQYGGTRVRLLEGIYDNRNGRSAFDPQNYSDEIYCVLGNGDECAINELYEIVSTTNKTGEVCYDYLGDSGKVIVHKDLSKKYQDDI